MTKMEKQLPFQVKYTVHYNDGAPEKDGRFTFGTDDPTDPAILKSILECEPGLDNVEYILGSIIPTYEPEPGLGRATNPIFNFTRAEIRQFREIA